MCRGMKWSILVGKQLAAIEHDVLSSDMYDEKYYQRHLSKVAWCLICRAITQRVTEGTDLTEAQRIHYELNVRLLSGDGAKNQD